eukprot:455278_1
MRVLFSFPNITYDDAGRLGAFLSLGLFDFFIANDMIKRERTVCFELFNFSLLTFKGWVQVLASGTSIYTIRSSNSYVTCLFLRRTTIPSEQKPTSVLDTYTLGHTLGPGATCRVVQATHKTNPKQHIALKLLDKTRCVTKKLYQREVSILQKLSQTNPSEDMSHIIPLVTHGEDNNYCYIVTPFMSGGELFERIISQDATRKITETIAIKLVLNMLKAVQYCHDRNVIHRDIKPENYVFADETTDSNLVLIDFGGSRIVHDDDIVDDIQGTPYYLGPELATAALNKYREIGQQVSDKIGDARPRTGKILKSSDVYAVGVIAFVMMTGRAPFRGKNKIAIYESTCLKSVRFPDKHARYDDPLRLSDNFKDFIRLILCKDPLKRISIEEAMRHPWLQGTEGDCNIMHHFGGNVTSITALSKPANMCVG